MSEGHWILELLGGDSRSIELPSGGTLVVGCSKERAGFVVEGQGVDEAHCAIGRTKEGEWAVKDLGSRHGTLLNGQRVAAARLKLGDQLVLGSRRLEVRGARREAERAVVESVGSARPVDAPQRIAGYRIERLIGRGGMGAVYLAVQESLRRPVALKVLAPRLAADRDFVLRFQAEARAAAALSHPNVVVVYDVGEENGAHYLSMEFMAGGSLEQKLTASGPLAWKTVLGVLGDAAAGLAYAESRGIVHRDIKPANLMYSGTGTAKIADLGLATTLEQEASEAEGGRRVFGTPHFISPEQARGQAVDHRSDLYSLGATAYRLLSGHTPFEGATTREILRALQSEAPRPLRELVAEVPDELDGLVRRLMEKDPEARFPSAEALRRECERLRLVAEHGPAPEVRAGGRGQLVLGLLLLVLVAGASAWYFRDPGNAAPPPTPDITGRPAVDLGAVPADPAGTLDDPAFFRPDPARDTEATGSVQDEEALLRTREREAGRALEAVPAFLAGQERLQALAKIRDDFPGTSAASSAAQQMEVLLAVPGTLGPTLEEVVSELQARLARLEQDGASLGAVLGAIEAFRPPAALEGEFVARRAALDAAAVLRSEAALRARLEQANRLAEEGRFDSLRGHLADLATSFAELDDLPGDPARLAGIEALRGELAARRERVDEQERVYRATVERAERRSVGDAIGPGSGLLAELGALDLEALERRMGALPDEVRGRPLCAILVNEARLAREALASLRREFERGGWRRKALMDPRTRRVREVRDITASGLILDQDGGPDALVWRDTNSDPDWWHQLFQARLGRDWSASEIRSIAALLRLVGAARGATLARELVDTRARGLLQPAELEALRVVFAPALIWAGAGDSELRASLEREQEAAERLAAALEAAQSHAWSRATAHLEILLNQRVDSLLIALLSDGTDWRGAAGPGSAPVSAESEAGGQGNAPKEEDGNVSDPLVPENPR